MNASGLCQCGCGERTKIATRNYAAKGHVKGQPLKFVRGHQNIGRPSPLKTTLPENASVFCECGCGELTPVATKTNRSVGIKRGYPLRFIPAHRGRTQAKGAAAHRWKGGRIVTGAGYVMVQKPGHPRANKDGYVYEHLIIAEKALGRPIPKRVEVHHFNEIKSDNRNGNLVICDSRAYHRLLHHRTWALRQTGSPTGSIAIAPVVAARSKESNHAH